MKKIVLVVLAAALSMGIGIQNASAATKKVQSSASTSGSSEEYSIKKGTFGFGVDTSTDMFIHGKYFVMNDLAIVAGFGLGIKGADDKGTDVAIGGGARKYFKAGDLAPFVGGFVTYASTKDSNVKDLGVFAEGGAEYFLARQFSFEGAIRLGYSSTETKTVDNFGQSHKVKGSNIGSNRASIGFNFYF